MISFFIQSTGTLLAITPDDLKSVTNDTVYFEASDTISGPVDGQGDCKTALIPAINDQGALADSINQYIESNSPANAPLRGLGDKFVTGGVRTGVNPFLLVTIARKESQFGHNPIDNGTDEQGRTNVPAYNAFGRTATEEQPYVITSRRWYRYDSWQDSLDGGSTKDDQPTYMKRRYIDQGLITITDVMMVYAPPGENNTELYIKQLNEWIDEMVELAGPSVNCNKSISWPIRLQDYQGVTTCWNTPRTLNGKNYMHAGLDIAASRGIDVLAAAAGTVEVVNEDASNGNGKYIVINHNNGLWTAYKHNQTNLVRAGQSVNQGDVIAKVDSTGKSTGDHLHFNVQKTGGIARVEDGGALNPLDYLPSDGRNLATSNPNIGTCIPGPKGQTGDGGQIINTN